MEKIAKLQCLIEKYNATPDLMVDKLSSVESRTSYGDQLIHIASVSGVVSDVVDLILLGSDVNSFGESGFTPLHYAAEQGHLEVVKALLDYGADPRLKDSSGEAALQVAEHLGNSEVIAYLKFKMGK